MNVITLGTFDLFHAGHVNLLRRCRDLSGPSGFVTVGLNTDAFVERYKGKAPVVGWEERAHVLRACRYVDRVIPNGQEDATAAPVIEASGATVIAVGSDWKDRDYLTQLGIDAEWLWVHGLRVEFFPYTDGISSTGIRGRLGQPTTVADVTRRLLELGRTA